MKPNQFFISLSRKTLGRFFILLHHCFYSFYRPQILTKQTGLTNQFVIPGKNLCGCVQKIKNKHDGGADFFLNFFISVCVTYSLVERPTVLLSTKDKNPGNEEV